MSNSIKTLPAGPPSDPATRTQWYENVLFFSCLSGCRYRVQSTKYLQYLQYLQSACSTCRTYTIPAVPVEQDFQYLHCPFLLLPHWLQVLWSEQYLQYLQSTCNTSTVPKVPVQYMQFVYLQYLYSTCSICTVPALSPSSPVSVASGKVEYTVPVVPVQYLQYLQYLYSTLSKGYTVSVQCILRLKPFLCRSQFRTQKWLTIILPR